MVAKIKNYNRDPGAHRKSQASGDFGEQIARQALHQFGICMIEKVNTPWKVLWAGKKIVNAFPVEKVSGDFIGIGVAGKKVLVEVKYREDKLSLSDFESHQIIKLEENSRLGGISLVVWIMKHEWAIYYWPAMHLEKGKPYQPGDEHGLQLSNPF
jgi:penicillin-binding protein-related factor A (putative recombinase)